MKRRIFLSLTSGVIPVSAVALEGPEGRDDPTALWWPMVSEVDEFRAVSVEGRLALEVALSRPGEEELEAVMENGSVAGYTLRGRPLVGGFAPGTTILTVFSLTWDGRPIPIAPRFWNDLAGLRVQTLAVDLETLELDQRAHAEACLAELDRPRVVLSADEGTALIEWSRSEKGGHRSMCRWVVSRGGTVLRHRHRASRMG